MSYIGSTPTSQNFTSGTDYFSGTGSQTAFTLTRTVNSVNDIEVVINNVVQQPSTAYTLSGTTITFTSAPSSGTNNIYVRYLATNMQSFTVPANSIDSNKLAPLTTLPVSGGYTATLPAATGTVMVSGNMPAFSAYRGSSSQSISATTWTKVQINTEEFDTNNCYDSTTNYRFTPNVAGYYQFSWGGQSSASSPYLFVIYKNGTRVKNGNITQAGAIGNSTSQAALIYANGTTDYFEMYAYSNGSFDVPVDSAGVYFQAFLARTA